MNKRIVKLIRATIACAAIGAIPCIADGMSVSPSGAPAHTHAVVAAR